MTGVVRFTSNPSTSSSLVAPAGVWVSYSTQGGPSADLWHGFHVHQWGDVAWANGSSVAGHFIGHCSNCRPGAKLQEIGFLFDGGGLYAPAKSLQQFDGLITLANDVNSIIGRSLIVHGNGQPNGAGVRIAQCVIGEAAPATPVDCAYTEWTAWPNTCSGAGAVRQSSTRAILTPASNGGLPCVDVGLPAGVSVDTTRHQPCSTFAAVCELQPTSNTRLAVTGRFEFWSNPATPNQLEVAVTATNMPNGTHPFFVVRCLLRGGSAVTPRHPPPPWCR